MNGQTAEIIAHDGFELASTLYEPLQHSWQNAVVVISPALGVPQSYYRRFATFLAAHGFAVVTYDYRGVGASRPDRLRSFRARMSQWVSLDLTTVIDWTSARFPEQSLLAVGHSLGGQLLGMTANHDRVSAVLLVAAQYGYWRIWPGWAKVRLAAFFYVGLPFSTRLCGYFPARWFGLGEDLPTGVALEWARWGRTRDYLTSLPSSDGGGFKRYRGQILAYSFADDQYAPRVTVDRLLRFYELATCHHRHLHPDELRTDAIGHFGFFRPRFRKSLWAEAAAWLTDQAPPHSTRPAPSALAEAGATT